MTTDDHTFSPDAVDALLTELDPAPPADPGAHLSPQASRILAGVTSAPAERAVPAGATARPISPAGDVGDDVAGRPRRRRSLALAGAAAAVGAGVVAASVMMGGGDAFASWTATPTAEPIADAAQVAGSCHDLWAETLVPGDDEYGLPGADEIAASDVALAERRGEFTLVVLDGDGYTAGCVARDGGLFRESAPMGAWLVAGEAGEVPADGEIADTVLSVDESVDGTAVVTVVGTAAPDVTGAVVHLPGGRDVSATVQGGYVAAWVPVDDAEAADLYSQEITATVTTPDGERTVVLQDPADVGIEGDLDEDTALVDEVENIGTE